MSSEDTNWWPPGAVDPAFEVRRPQYGVTKGGDYTRGGDADLAKAAVRYADPHVIPTPQVGQGILTARPYDYHTVEIQWAQPPAVLGTWEEVAIVRSTFGCPSTVRDGVTIMRSDWSVIPAGSFYNRDATLTIYDRNDPFQPTSNPGLESGYWYYYSLFFLINPRNWVRSMTTSVLLPRDYRHSEHMWEGVPPYYRWTDDTYEPNNGPLRQYIKIFGFEMDLTREYAESWQKVYNLDYSPMRLLRRVADNLGWDYESALGDIRFRSFLTRIGFLYDIRGTRRCLEEVCEAASKWECDTTDSQNLMLLPDDSDFYGYGINATEGDGTGSWAGLHPDVDPTLIDPGVGYIAPPSKVFLRANSVKTVTPPEKAGRGTMRMTTRKDEETLPVMITCGCGITWLEREVIPRTNGIPILGDLLYGFSVQIKMQKPSFVQVALLWFSRDGMPENLIGAYRALADMPVADDWHTFTVQAQAPENATYLVPCVYFQTRDPGTSQTISPYADLAGAQVYNLGDINSPVTTIGPDRYLTVGDPAEKIGAPPNPDDPDFAGWVMGSPPK